MEQREQRYVAGGGLSGATQIILGLTLVVELLVIGSLFFRLYFLHELELGNPGAQPALDANDQVLGGFALAQLALLLLCAVPFTLWVHRAYKNLKPLRGEHLEYSPGRAAASFYIPFVNLIRPYRVLKDIWRASDPILDRPVTEKTPETGLIGTWWLLYIGTGLVSTLADSLTSEGDSIHELTLATAGMLPAEVMWAGAALAAILMLRAVDQRFEARRNALLLYEPMPLGT